ncbi:MAG TPA: heme o synthase [Vicinamibacterales bacterium]|nr:heme o synthase [Vicinamibacterales bacterium]
MKGAAVPAPHADVWQTISDYVALTKPRLNVLVVATSAAGYYLGANSSVTAASFLSTVIGTTLVAGGAAALNQVYERDTDALMQRTRMRPLPNGRISPTEAGVFGTMLSLAGLVLLAVFSTWLAAALALATLVTYLFVYTPLKRRSPAATVVGAVPGALPPLIGWAAAHGGIAVGGLALFLIVFLWQIPHFMAIAWMYRDDYGAAGFPMLPVIDPEGRRAGRQAVGYAAALLPTSLVPTLVSLSGVVYGVVAAALGIALLVLSVRFAGTRTNAAARQLFFATLVYLPLIWIVMIADKR